MLTKQVNIFLNRSQGVVARSFWDEIKMRIRDRQGKGKVEDVKLVLEKPEMYIEAYRQMLLDCAEKFFLKVVYPNFTRAVDSI